MLQRARSVRSLSIVAAFAALSCSQDREPHGACDPSDPEDPNCDFCDYPENAADPACTDESSVEPLEPPFLPQYIDIRATVAYDPAIDAFRGYRTAAGAEMPLFFEVYVIDWSRESTADRPHLCQARLVPNSADPIPAVVVEAVDDWTGSDSPPPIRRGIALELKPGEFSVTRSSNDSWFPDCHDIPGSMDWRFAEGHENLLERLENYTYGLGIGEMGSFVDENLSSFTNPVLVERYEGGFYGGGFVRISRPNISESDSESQYFPAAFVQGWELNEAFQEVSNPSLIHSSDMLSDADGLRPGAGLYDINTFFLGIADLNEASTGGR